MTMAQNLLIPINTMAWQCASEEQVQEIIQRALQLHQEVNELLGRAEQWSRDYQRALARVQSTPANKLCPQQKSFTRPAAQHPTYETRRERLIVQLESGKSGMIPLSSYPSFRDNGRGESHPTSTNRRQRA
jgi:hypothetical protein